MYSLLRTPHPPTGVEHSIEAHFFGPWERNLLVAGANILRVFRLVPDLTQNNPDEPNTAVINEQTGEVTVNGRPVKMRLECVASFSLFGEIMDLQKVNFRGKYSGMPIFLKQLNTHHAKLIFLILIFSGNIG